MTGNEPGSTGSDQLDSEAEEARRQKHGSMREAQDNAARDVGDGRSRDAVDGDAGAQAEQAGETGDSSHDACPLCGHPMGEHAIDRSHANAVLICPVPPNPEVLSSEPLNEVGMIKRRKD